MANYRMQKINAEIQKAISELISSEITNPIIAKCVISIISLDTAPDFSSAKVYISVLGGDDRQIVFNEISKSANFLRKRLAEKLNLKKTPRLIFLYDDGIENANRINFLLDEMKKKG